MSSTFKEIDKEMYEQYNNFKNSSVYFSRQIFNISTNSTYSKSKSNVGTDSLSELFRSLANSDDDLKNNTTKSDNGAIEAQEESQGPLPCNIQNDGKFFFKPTSSKKSFIIGNEEDTSYPNAIVASNHRCDDEVIIPGKFTFDGIEYPVEVIGFKAFYSCSNSYGRAKSIFVPKEIKVIRALGLSYLDFVSNFTIEAGSKLEIIESKGLGNIGMEKTDPLTPTLILPSTLHSFAKDGIFWCNLFTSVIYCGTKYLNENTSSFDIYTPAKTKVYTTHEYLKENKQSNIFKVKSALDLSSERIYEICESHLALPEQSKCEGSTRNIPISRVWTLACALLAS